MLPDEAAACLPASVSTSVKGSPQAALATFFQASFVSGRRPSWPLFEAGLTASGSCDHFTGEDMVWAGVADGRDNG